MRELLVPEGHPSRHLVMGEPETVSAITREDLVAFHARHFGPKVLTVSIVGGVASIEQAAALIDERFADWESPAERPADLPPILARDAESRDNRVITGKSQSDIAIGFPTLKRSDPDYFPLELGNLILGRLGLMGRLGSNVRDLQGLPTTSTGRCRPHQRHVDRSRRRRSEERRASHHQHPRRAGPPPRGIRDRSGAR